MAASVAVPAAAAEQQDADTFAGIPFIRDDDMYNRVTLAAITDLKYPLVQQVTGLTFVTKTGSNDKEDEHNVPNILFNYSENTKEKQVSSVLVVTSAPFATFFGDLITKKPQSGTPALYTTPYGKKSRSSSMWGALTSLGQTATKWERRFDPFAGTSKRDDSFELVGGDGTQRLFCPDPYAAILECMLTTASHKYHEQKKTRVADVPQLLPMEDMLKILTQQDYSFTKGPMKEQVILMKPTHRVTNQGSAFPLIRPLFTKVTGMPECSTADKLRMKNELLTNYPDVVTAIFGSPENMDCSNAYMTLLRCAGAFRRLLTAVPGITLEGLVPLMTSHKNKDVYEFNVPTVCGPDGSKLTLRDLYKIQFERPEGWVPLIAAAVAYETWYVDSKNATSAILNPDVVRIIGFVPQTECDVVEQQAPDQQSTDDDVLTDEDFRSRQTLLKSASPFAIPAITSGGASATPALTGPIAQPHSPALDGRKRSLSPAPVTQPSTGRKKPRLS